MFFTSSKNQKGLLKKMGLK